MAWDHPIPQGRWAALHDEAFWCPMLGIVSCIVERCGLEAEQAGDLITSGMAKGEIGHRIEGSNTWIVAPRGAELAQRAGLSYETGLDWSKGCLVLPGGKPQLVSIFWPDVERAVHLRSQFSKDTADIHSGTSTQHNQRAKPGPRPLRKQEVLEKMRNEIATGVLTKDALAGMKQASLEADFGASRKTCVAARDELLANSRK